MYEQRSENSYSTPLWNDQVIESGATELLASCFKDQVKYNGLSATFQSGAAELDRETGAPPNNLQNIYQDKSLNCM